MNQFTDEMVDRMIEKTPRALRRELIVSIQNLEAALELSGFKTVSWTDALERYRRFKESKGPARVALLGLLPQIVIDYAKDLDRAFKRIYLYDPAEFDTKPMRDYFSIRQQTARGKKSGESRKEKAKQADLKLEKFVKAVCAKIPNPGKYTINGIRENKVKPAWETQFKNRDYPGRAKLDTIIKNFLSELSPVQK